MEVIGDIKKWTEEVVCKDCGAQLRIEASDLIVRNTAMFYAGETWDPVVLVKCAVCDSEVYVTKKVPSGIRDRLFRMYREGRGL